ncbi:hypothetical protein VCHA53O466_50027 [Vibrio chagasii]|nr:hypothetical protein VCHA53O466_50027 [Vibrio chagasii]
MNFKTTIAIQALLASESIIRSIDTDVFPANINHYISANRIRDLAEQLKHQPAPVSEAEAENASRIVNTKLEHSHTHIQSLLDRVKVLTPKELEANEYNLAALEQSAQLLNTIASA